MRPIYVIQLKIELNGGMYLWQDVDRTENYENAEQTAKLLTDETDGRRQYRVVQI